MLEIKQMEYLKEIVNSDYNLRIASEKLYLSQSALSQFIKKFETQYGIILFQRKKGRIVGLTDSGRKIYEACLKVLDRNDVLVDIIDRERSRQRGTIRFGAHPTLLRLFFTKFIPSFKLENPEAHIEILENGSIRNRENLLSDRLDMAIIVQPTELIEKDFEEYPLVRTEVVAFLNPHHPLEKKRILTWEDLRGYPIVTYGKDDLLNVLINDKMAEENIDLNIIYTSDSWDYLIEGAVATDIIALLPTVYFPMYMKRLEHLGIVE